jgi:6-phosphogluconolactonase
MTEKEVQIFKDLDTLSRAAAERFAAIVAEAVEARGHCIVALSGGGTPQTLYRLLAQSPYHERLPWAQTYFFWGDERCVPADDPESNYHQARLALLSQIGIPLENIHRVKGEWEPARAAQDYAAQLHRASRGESGLAWPRFDLVLLGMGSDGHTASLFPGPIAAAELDSPTLAVTAHYQGRPANRVTLTPLVFNSARNILFMVTGADKAEALAAVLAGSFDPKRWPAQRIRPEQGSVAWFVDEAACNRLLKRENP